MWDNNEYEKPIPSFFLETPADPDTDIITMDDLKGYLRIPVADTSQENTLRALMHHATDLAEAFTRRKFLTQTWSVYWDRFPFSRRLELRLAPFKELLKFEYMDRPEDSFVDVDASVYQMDDKNIMPAISLKTVVGYWPVITCRSINAVHAKVICGYGAPEDVPDGIKMAIARMVSTFYDNAGDVVQGQTITPMPLTFSARSLLMPYKIYTF